MLAARATIQYFETQQQQRCLQHAFNNLWQGPYMMLTPDLALQGADMGEICASGTSPVIAPDGACMRRIVLSSAQLRALIPVFTEYVERLLVSEAMCVPSMAPGTIMGCYGSMAIISCSTHFRTAPSGCKTPPPITTNSRAPFGLVAAVPGGTPNPILDYAALLQQGAFAAVCRALEDVHGEQPIIALASQPLMDAAAGLQGARPTASEQMRWIAQARSEELYADRQPGQSAPSSSSSQYGAAAPGTRGNPDAGGHALASAQTWQAPDSPASSMGSVLDDMLDAWDDDGDLDFPASPEIQAAMAPGLSPATLQYTSSASLPGAGLAINHRNALLAALRDAAYAPAVLVGLTFADLDKKWASLSGDVQRAIDVWRKDWDRFPEETGKTEGRVFITKNGNAIRSQNVTRILSAYDSKLAQLQQGSIPSPGDWDKHRNALLAALRDAGDDSAVLARLTFAELDKKRASLSKDAQHAIDVWRKDWDRFPKGAGKKDGRVFIARNGNAISSPKITQSLSAYDSKLAKLQ